MYIRPFGCGADVDGTCNAGDTGCDIDMQKKPELEDVASEDAIKRTQKLYLLHEDEPEQVEEVKVENNANTDLLDDAIKMMRTVYAEIHANIPFDIHPLIVSLQEHNGLNFKYSNYDKSTAIEMASLLSRHIHTILLKHLIAQKRPVSIIIDRSIGFDRQHYLLVYFMAVETNVPVLYFYSLIPIYGDETASQLFDSVMKKFDSEKLDIKSYIKENLFELVTDGSSLVTKGTNGLAKYFRNFTNRPLYSIHFLAYKMHLAIIRSFDAIDYFKTFESDILEINFFYSLRSHTRQQPVREFIARIREFIHDIRSINNVDWVSSDLSLLVKIRDFWPMLIKDFDEISNDKSFDIESRTEASTISRRLKGKNFVLTLNFLIDVLDQLDYYLILVQRRVGLLIEFSSLYDDFLRSFESLKVKSGRSTQLYLNETVCDLNRICSEMDTYFNADTVIYKEIELTSDEDVPDYLKLDKIKEKFFQELIDEIMSYFPDINLKEFEIFTPQYLPRFDDQKEINSYGQDTIKSLCLFLKLGECELFQNDWIRLLQSIVKNKHYAVLRTKTPLEFWSDLLILDEISWTLRTKTIIHTMLAFSVGSADIQKGSEIMNDIRVEHRDSVTLDELDMIMRIRINGPSDIKNFKAERYAKAWLLEQRINSFEDFTLAERKNI